MGPPQDPEIRKKIHEALEETEGNYKRAAEIAGIALEELHRVVNLDDALRTRWMDPNRVRGENTPPPNPDSLAARTTAEDIANEVLRECDGDPSNHPAKLLAESVNSENFKLKSKGIEGLKLSEKAMEMAIRLQSFEQNEIAPLVKMAMSSAAMQIINLNVEIDDAQKRLAGLREKLSENEAAYGSKYRDDLLEEESTFMVHIRSLNEELMRVKDSVEKGMAVQVLIAKASKDLQSKKEKAGYGKSKIKVVDADSNAA